MNLISIILLGISLSIDAFSFSIAYGMLNISNSKILLTSAFVGIFHFIMPFLGSIVGNIIFLNTFINPKIFLMIIFIILAYEIYKGEVKKNEIFNLNILNIIIFSFMVSIDGFTAGLGLNFLTQSAIISSIIISIIVFIITFIGFKLGGKINEKIGLKSKNFAIFILIILTVYILFK